VFGYTNFGNFYVIISRLKILIIEYIKIRIKALSSLTYANGFSFNFQSYRFGVKTKNLVIICFDINELDSAKYTERHPTPQPVRKEETQRLKTGIIPPFLE